MMSLIKCEHDKKIKGPHMVVIFTILPRLLHRYPHENGHIQVYLGYCGASETACEKFDASTISYFKILSLKQGLASKKEFPYNKHKDGNEVRVPISNTLPMGSYIMRIELSVVSLHAFFALSFKVFKVTKLLFKGG
jgi:hypothetical protein